MINCFWFVSILISPFMQFWKLNILISRQFMKRVIYIYISQISVREGNKNNSSPKEPNITVFMIGYYVNVSYKLVEWCDGENHWRLYLKLQRYMSLGKIEVIELSLHTNAISSSFLGQGKFAINRIIKTQHFLGICGTFLPIRENIGSFSILNELKAMPISYQIVFKITSLNTPPWEDPEKANAYS